MAEVEQQPRRRGGARHLVHGDGRHRGVRGCPRPRPRGTSSRRWSSWCVILSCPALTRMPSTLWRAAARAPGSEPAVEAGEPGDGHEVAVRVRGALEPQQHRGRPEGRRLDADHPERLRAAGDQRLRRGIRAVVQLAHRAAHPLAGRLRRRTRCALTTRETVCWETPASLATSPIVAAPLAGWLTASLGVLTLRQTPCRALAQQTCHLASQSLDAAPYVRANIRRHDRPEGAGVARGTPDGRRTQGQSVSEVVRARSGLASEARGVSDAVAPAPGQPHSRGTRRCRGCPRRSCTASPTTRSTSRTTGWSATST